MLEFDQMLSLSLSGFAWHAFLVQSNLKYLKISLALQRSPDITMHNGTSKRNTHTHTSNTTSLALSGGKLDRCASGIGLHRKWVRETL